MKRGVNKSYSCAAAGLTTVSIPIPSISGYTPISTGEFNVGGGNIVIEHTEIANGAIKVVLYNGNSVTISTKLYINIIYARNA